MTRKTSPILSILLTLLGVICLVAAMGLLTAPATAQESTEQPATETIADTDEAENTGEAEAEAEEPEPASDAYCLLCHENTDEVWHLPSGETLDLEINPSLLANSVHGSDNPEGALMCADCHGDFRYPHPATNIQTIREFRVDRYTSCRSCHEEQYTHSQDSVHGAALRNGKTEAAMCVDCHGGHDIQPPDEPRERISLTCGRCHGAIFEEYRTSVHGTALLEESNADVPTCIDCHGVHNIQDPTTTLFRQRSPELCAGCHADTDLMAQYDISTEVFTSYLAEFHGSTVALFEQEAPNVVTTKAVCYDCHGVHNIQSIEEGGDAAIRSTLLNTCRECHPNASADFSDAWIGHYPATLDNHPGLFVVSGLYNIGTPIVVGLLGIVVGVGVLRQIGRRLFGRRRSD